MHGMQLQVAYRNTLVFHGLPAMLLMLVVLSCPAWFSPSPVPLRVGLQEAPVSFTLVQQGP